MRRRRGDATDAPRPPAAPELEVKGGLDLDAGMAQGEALVGRPGRARRKDTVHPVRPAGLRRQAGRPAWPLSAPTTGPSSACRAARVSLSGRRKRLNLNVQPYHHLLVSIDSAPAATLTCVGSGETGTLRLEGRFAVAVTEIPTANSVVLTAVAGD